DVFVGRRLSLGVALGFSYTRGVVRSEVWNAGGSSYSIAAMPRIGYAVPLGHGFSLWPRVGFGYAHVVVTSSDGYNEYDRKAASWMGTADLGLIFQATRRVFVAMRPELTIGVSETTP